MSNHFHIYLQTPQTNLSRFMQSFLTSFCVSYNKKRRSSGHLFQGRFKSHLVESELYHSKLSRYIHLNPVRTAQIKPLPIEEKRDYLKNYKWSSFRYYIGIQKAPKWIALKKVLSHWGPDIESQMPEYRKYVEEGLLKDVENPFDDLREQSIIGSDSFIDKIKRKYLLFRKKDCREQPSLVHFQSSFSIEEVMQVVSRYYGVDSDSLLSRRSPSRDARRLLMYCACIYCCSMKSLSEIATSFGVSVSGLTRARDRVKVSIAEDKQQRKQLKVIENQLKLR